MAATNGTVHVIVGIEMAGREFSPEGLLPGPADVDTQRRSISEAGAGLGASLAGQRARVYRSWDSLPYLALEVDSEALAVLAHSPLVSTIAEDALVGPQLLSAMRQVGGDVTARGGFGGAGQTVVILDTGIDGNHPFFGNRVVAQGCWSAAAGGKSLCPGGGGNEIGPGRADALTGQCFHNNVNLCSHGTHVAGIVAGADPGVPNASPGGINGVAPQADIIAIQVFTRFENAADCSPGAAPCVRSYTSDQMSALQYVNNTLRHHWGIAAVNMSLGGGQYTGACDGDPRKAAIDNLLSNDIATVIAAGNEGLTAAVAAPGCISSAVTVGSTDDPSDSISYFSNMNATVDLLAPGNSIDSSVPDDAYGKSTGTSMATPVVAGALAVLKAETPGATVEQLLGALKATGISVTDTRPAKPAGAGNGTVKPRIQLDTALASLATCGDAGVDFGEDCDTSADAGCPGACGAPGTPQQCSCPLPDLCASPRLIPGFPYRTTRRMDTRTANKSNDDPSLPCGAGGKQAHSVWYRFVAPLDGMVSADTSGSKFDTVLAALQGTCGNMVLLPGACNDNDGGTKQSRIHFAVKAGQTYSLEVTSFGTSGGGLLSLTATLSYCGDGEIDAGLGEGCDDGNSVTGDGCTPACVDEFCGDGIINDRHETCDDGNTVSGDGCSAVCSDVCGEDGCTMFVTSSKHMGNLGGFAGGDGICNARAASAKLPGVYKAWLGSLDGAGTRAHSRLYPESGPFVRTCGGTIANNLADLEDGTLAVPVQCDEFGTVVDPTGTWTGAQAVGGYPDAGCVNWTMTAAYGATGSEQMTDGRWTEAGWRLCSEARRLYCIEQTHPPVCGNGVLQLGEDCEDGNSMDGDGCDSNCTVTGCGNGVVTAPEQCDDGNTVAGDGCTGSCLHEAEYCGDGIVNVGETCEDGNTVSGDGCSSTCRDETTELCGGDGCTMFVTSSKQMGNLGGFSGGDAICNARAASGGLTGIYKAWLGSLDDGGTRADSRLDPASGPFINTCGGAIASNLADLEDGSLSSPIQCDEFGVVVEPTGTWTGARAVGGYPDNGCVNWTMTAAYGATGSEQMNDARWTEAGWRICSEARRIYCIEQTHPPVCGNGILQLGEECDDGNTAGGDCCTANCAFEPASASCASDGNPCTNDVCDGAGHCGADNTASCDDGLFCNGTDTCVAGSCSQHSGNACKGPDGDADCAESCNETTDTCKGADPDGSACTDGLYCNGADTCASGLCAQHTGSPCPGPDGDRNCKESCNEATDTCNGADPDGSVCSDWIFCDGADACLAGSCSQHKGDPCRGPDGDGNCKESCDEATNSCTAADPNGSACQDGSFCTAGDACSGGSCIGGSSTTCNDANGCTDDTCVEATDKCSYQDNGSCGTRLRDYDGDFTDDVLMKKTTSVAFRLFLFDGGTAVTSSYLAIPGTGGGDWKVVAEGDFDGDATTDLLLRRPLTGAWRVASTNGVGPVVVTALGLYTTANWELAAVGDFDGDWTEDVVMRNNLNGAGRVFFIRKAAAVSNSFTALTTALNWKVVGSGDFDGDGVNEILQRNATTGAVRLVYVLPGVTPAVLTVLSVAADPTMSVGCVADLDGDGVDDILTRRASDNASFVLEMKLGQVVSVHEVALDPTQTVQKCEDYDGSGVDDVLMLDPATGVSNVFEFDGGDVVSTTPAKLYKSPEWTVVP